MRPSQPLHPRRYLVTGGRGFIGRHLLARLVAQGAEVHATTRSDPPPAEPGVRWWRVDLADAAATEVDDDVRLQTGDELLGGHGVGQVDPPPATCGSAGGVADRVVACTSAPCAASRASRWRPMKPRPPVTR